MNLYQASSQWANRPDDERFESLEALHKATDFYRRASKEVPVDMARMKVVPMGDEPVLVGPNGGHARFTHYAFGQFANRIGAPANYLRGLPAGLVAQNLTFGLQHMGVDNTRLLMQGSGKDGDRLVRAATSDIYARIWNADIAQWCMGLPQGWRVPPARPARAGQAGTRPATQADVLSGGSFDLSIKVGQPIAPAGLYASDHDLFIFMVNQERAVEASTGEQLFRGFFVTNSEVGDKSLRLTMFLYANVCGNHIVWGAEDIMEIRIRHVGQQAFREFHRAKNQILSAVERAGSEDEKRIQAAKSLLLGDGKQNVIDLVSKRGIFGPKVAEKVWAKAEEYSDVHGDPRSAWGFAAGATRLSGESSYQDERDLMDRAARKVLELAF